MLNPEEIEAIQKGGLVLNCDPITVRGVEENQRPYRGAGELRVVRSAPPAFQLTETRQEPDRVVFGGAAGTRTRVHDLPTFEAVDLQGRTWVGRVQVKTTPFEHHGGTALRLTSRGRASENSPALRLVFHTDVHPPQALWCLADENNTRLTFRQLHGSLLVDVEAQDDVTSDYYMRVEEALWFTTRRIVTASLVERRIGTENESALLAPLRSNQGALFGLPLRSWPQFSGHLGRIFLHYLDYAQSAPAERFHPTSADLRILLSAADATIEQAAIAACIALEAFVRREYAAEGSDTASFLGAVDRALAAVISVDIDEAAAQRIRGALAAMRSPSPRTALRRLAAKGFITEEQRKAWERLRHRFVHGFAADEDHDRVIDGTLRVFQALTQLVLRRIGYDGPLNDISRVGHPLIQIGEESAGAA